MLRAQKLVSKAREAASKSDLQIMWTFPRLQEEAWLTGAARDCLAYGSGDHVWVLQGRVHLGSEKYRVRPWPSCVIEGGGEKTYHSIWRACSSYPFNSHLLDARRFFDAQRILDCVLWDEVLCRRVWVCYANRTMIRNFYVWLRWNLTLKTCGWCKSPSFGGTGIKMLV